MNEIKTIEYWYDRNCRSWVLQLKDAEGNQIGPAEFAGTRTGIVRYAEDAKTRHPNATIVQDLIMSSPPEVEEKVTPAFLAYLEQQANKLEMDAGHSGRTDDGGARRLRDCIAAYEAGRAGIVPRFWLGYLTEFTKTQDPEYATYERLREKFEGNPR